MRILPQSTIDELLEEGYQPISKQEALEYIEIGLPVAVQLQLRENYEIDTKLELQNCENLKDQRIYEFFNFYIKL